MATAKGRAWRCVESRASRNSKTLSKRMSKRLKTMAPSDRLLYSLGAKRFASPTDQQWHAILEVLVPFLMFEEYGRHAPTLRSLLLVNSDAKDTVLSELRSDPESDGGDVATAFCNIARACEICCCHPEIPIGARVWNPWTKTCVDDSVLLCLRCSDQSTVSLTRDDLGYANNPRLPDDPTTKSRPTLDKRILQPDRGLEGVQDFVDSLASQPQVTLFVPNGKSAVTRRLNACDVTPMLAPMLARIDTLDHQKKLADQVILDDIVRNMLEFLGEYGVTYGIDPPLLIDEVRAAPNYYDAETEREDLAGSIKLVMRSREEANRLGYVLPDRDRIDDFCDTLRRRAVHPTFDWVHGPFSVDTELIMCDCILNGGVRVRRMATVTWTPRRGPLPPTSVVDIAVELPFRRRPTFLVHTTTEVADALGPCCAKDSTVFRGVEAEFLPALAELMTTCRSARFDNEVAWHMLKAASEDADRKTPARRLRLPSYCVHFPPPKVRVAWWQLQSCSRCGHQA